LKENVESIVEEIMTLYSKYNKSSIPLEIIVKEFHDKYTTEEIEHVIEYALDTFKIDKVLDYPAKEWDLYRGVHTWHVSKLNPDDESKLRNLSAVDLAFLRILKNQNTPKQFGRIKSDDARIILRNQGFTEKEVEFLWVEDLVDHYYDFKDEKSIEWCRLIPEEEKTEEYKKAEEEMHREWEEKEARRMYYADVNDLADQIRGIVKESPDGISKEAIVKQLFMSDPEYVDHAFEIEIQFSDILPITLDDGEVGYRLHPEYDGG